MPDSNEKFNVWAGTKVQFIAEALPGYQFIEWTGDHFDPTQNPQTIEVGSAKTVTANFTIALVVPEYAYGALIPLVACLMAFFTIRRHKTYKPTQNIKLHALLLSCQFAAAIEHINETTFD